MYLVKNDSIITKINTNQTLKHPATYSTRSKYSNLVVALRPSVAPLRPLRSCVYEICSANTIYAFVVRLVFPCAILLVIF